MRFQHPRFLRDRQGLAAGAVFDRAVTLRILHRTGKYGRALDAHLGRLQGLPEVMAIKDIIAKDQCKRSAGSQQVLESRQILVDRDNQDLGAPAGIGVVGG